MADEMTIEQAMSLSDHASPLPSLAGQALKMLRAEIERYRHLCGAVYQAAGAFDLPERFLDALSDASMGSIEARRKTDDLLPCCGPEPSEGAQAAVAEVYERPRDSHEPVPVMVKDIRFIGMPLPSGTVFYTAPPAAAVPDNVERVAQHIARSVEYIEKAYPGVKHLDAGPILSNMRRWAAMLAAAPQPEAKAVPDGMCYCQEGVVCPSCEAEAIAATVPQELYRSACESAESWKARALEAEQALERMRLEDSPTFMGEPLLPHTDDAAVDRFVAAMKAKLAEARAKGRGGWQDKADCPQQRLSDMLRAHVEKGDPRDVANFCMFLHQRGESILPASSDPVKVPEGLRDRLRVAIRALFREQERYFEDLETMLEIDQLIAKLEYIAGPKAWCPQCRAPRLYSGDPECIHLHLCHTCHGVVDETRETAPQPAPSAGARDADRYRWLRDECDTTAGFLLGQRIEADEWDKTIDAAMAAQRGGES